MLEWGLSSRNKEERQKKLLHRARQQRQEWQSGLCDADDRRAVIE